MVGRKVALMSNFNPRSLVGNDGLMLRTSSGKVYFNPRSLVGNDEAAADMCKVPLEFQSTFPRGERQRMMKEYIRNKDFNPRSLVGNDLVSICFFLP